MTFLLIKRLLKFNCTNGGDIMEGSFVVSRKYENKLDIKTRKERGIYYTPYVVVKYILDNTIGKHRHSTKSISENFRYELLEWQFFNTSIYHALQKVLR